MKWIGITGGIATGKSSVSSILRQSGFRVIDADQVAREVVVKGSLGLRAIEQAFGPDVITDSQELDRQSLAKIIFADQTKREKLNAILHPLIHQEVQKQKSEAMANGLVVCFYDVPLLFENHLQNQFDQTWMVTCSSETQLQRLMVRNQLSQAEAQQRILAQMPLVQKEKLASLVIKNDADIESLKKVVAAAIHSIQT